MTHLQKYVLRGLVIVSAVALLAVLALNGNTGAVAEQKTPPLPAKYKVKLRYKIEAPRAAHIIQFDEMVSGLKKQGFQFVPDLDDLPATLKEDPGNNTLTGVINGKNALELLDVPFVASLVLVPDTFNLPKDPTQRVQVQLDLVHGFPLHKQLELVDQVRALLIILGFEEMSGYDHHGFTGKPHTRLRGTIAVDQLETLLKDLRRQPTGWFTPLLNPEKLPEPFRMESPILATTVIADPTPPRPPLLPSPRGDIAFEKIGPELWELVKQNKVHADDMRIEVIWAVTPTEGEAELWQLQMQKVAPNFNVEDRLGNLVSGVFYGPYVDDKGVVYDSQVKDDFNQIKALAKLPFVSVVRLPQPALVQVDPVVMFQGENALALQKSGMAEYHKKGHKGKGVRLAIIDSDFRGHQDLIDKGQLPQSTFLVDLTQERSPNFLPDPIKGDPAQLGHGTHSALAAALAAPEAELVLVRIDPAAPLMFKTALEYFFGDYVISPHMAKRHGELVQTRVSLKQLRDQVMFERKIVLDNFDDDKDWKEQYDFLGPAAGWIFVPRDWHFARMAELEKAEANYLQKNHKYFQYLQQLKKLKGINIISSSLVWNDTYPLGGRSVLTKWIDDKVRPKYVTTPAGDCVPKVIKGQAKPLWFQSVGNTRGQNWYGPFRDEDGNGAMEFAGFRDKLPEGSWTPELNFLAWQPYQGKQVQELPANTKFRLSLQWTEPHDADYFFRLGEADEYLKPLSGLSLVILRQRDPTGTTLSEDDFEVVARSYMLPQRLDNTPTSATYELFVEWTATKPGRYAVRVEKFLSSKWIVQADKEFGGLAFSQFTDLTPTGLRPLGAPTLPALEKKWELYPRFFVQALAGEGAGKGRPVFRDFATDIGNIGIPADGRIIISVGAADFDGKPEPFSAAGPPVGMPLFASPTVLSFDRLELGGKPGPAFGTSLATPFAAGTAAAILSSGTAPEEFLHFLHQQRKKTVKGVKPLP